MRCRRATSPLACLFAASIALGASCASGRAALATKREAAAAELVILGRALERFAADNHGLFPDRLLLLLSPGDAGRPYLDAKRLPRDPWDRAYRYDPPSAERARPRVYSLGADGRPGGSGEARDIEHVLDPTRTPSR